MLITFSLGNKSSYPHKYGKESIITRKALLLHQIFKTKIIVLFAENKNHEKWYFPLKILNRIFWNSFFCVCGIDFDNKIQTAWWSREWSTCMINGHYSFQKASEDLLDNMKWNSRIWNAFLPLHKRVGGVGGGKWGNRKGK